MDAPRSERERTGRLEYVAIARRRQLARSVAHQRDRRRQAVTDHSRRAGAELARVLRPLSFANEPAPPVEGLLLGRRRRQLRARKTVAPLPRPRRVDDRARREALLVGMDARV